MSLLPSTASFEELVQDCFFTFRGSGLMLSALDVELVTSWAERQIPYEVVARGIRRAAEGALFDAKPGEPCLRSLRSCKRSVESEIKKFLGRDAGAHAEDGEPADSVPAHVKRHARLRASLKKLSRDRPELAKPLLRLLRGRLEREPSSLSEASTDEEAVYLVLLRSLPFETRSALLREGTQLAQRSGALSFSRDARKMSRRFHRTTVVKRHLSLPSFW